MDTGPNGIHLETSVRHLILLLMTEPSHDSRLARAKPGGNSMRHPAGTMICPRCERRLQGSDHALGIAWRCGKCGGQSLNFSQFRRMVPEQGANAIWENVTARPDPPLHRTRCPECLNSMNAVHIPLHGRRIELDICRPCQRLWLDRQEDDGVASVDLTSSPASAALLRSSSWFTPRNAIPRTNDEIHREAAWRFFRTADKAERDDKSRWVIGSLWRGVIAGLIVYFLAWPLPAVIKLRLGTVAFLVCFVLRMLRR